MQSRHNGSEAFVNAGASFMMGSSFASAETVDTPGLKGCQLWQRVRMVSASVCQHHSLVMAQLTECSHQWLLTSSTCCHATEAVPMTWLATQHMVCVRAGGLAHQMSSKVVASHTQDNWQGTRQCDRVNGNAQVAITVTRQSPSSLWPDRRTTRSKHSWAICLRQRKSRAAS